MRPTLAFALLAALVCAAPAADASWLFSKTIHLAPYRIGDVIDVENVWRYVEDGKVSSGNDTTLAKFSGLSHAADAYGTDRATLDVRMDNWWSYAGTDSKTQHGANAALVRCLVGGNQSVETDVLAGNAWSYNYSYPATRLLGLTISPGFSYAMSLAVLKTYGDGCPGGDPFATKAIKESQRVRLGDLFPDATGRAANATSAPAVVVDFYGRDAVSLVYDEAAFDDHADGSVTGTTTFVLADGLPGIARASWSTTKAGPGGWSATGTTWLAGISTRADAAPIPAWTGAQLPARNPTATFRPYDPLAIDDTPFAFPYPFADAWPNLQTDPQMGLGSWLSAHPGARLTQVNYDRDADGGGDGSGPTQGGWYLLLSDGHAAHAWWTSRNEPASRAGALLPGAVRNAPAFVHDIDEGVPTWTVPALAEPPAQVLDLASAARQAEARGLPAIQVRALSVGAYPYAMTDQLSPVGPSASGHQTGQVLKFDARSGGLSAVYSTDQDVHSGRILDIASPPALAAPTDRAAAFSALAGPGFGAGLAGGAALTGLALLLLAVKFLLIPLFTRLRRDGLLDNPVRARLYERVRAEPGIHLAELVDFAGIGEGATRHHLDQLAKHRLLTRLEAEGFVRYYASGEVPPEVARREAVLRAGSLRAVYDLYAREPSLSLREAGARLGLSAPSVHRAKKKLEKAGLLPAAHEASVGAAA